MIRTAYARHADELYGFAVRALGEVGLAEAALKETFLRLWRERDRIDPETESIRTRLFAILGDVVIDLGHRPVERSLVAWQVEEAMHRIEERYRQVLVETYYRGRSCAEVAAELGVAEGTVRNRVHDGLRALNVALEELTLDR